jgi:dihydrofolate reductase
VGLDLFGGRPIAKLIFSANTSLDGYVADAEGKFDWSTPDEEVHRFINDLERRIGTHLYGRRMYEVLVAWETIGSHPDEPPYIYEYGEIWRAAEKIVYSTTLETVSSARTRIEREFDPEAIRKMKASLDRDISVGGPTLAAEAIRAGLVDDYHFLVSPVVVGGGLRTLPDGFRVDLELLDERRFDNGVVYLHYRAG